ncbi:ArsR/SmtB family transcription factor [Vallitalea okinawensis]|uniref:ArsR/SmtB family transcription factor n=1 Tax=Vallitalea okinawensis TaxID=2078660 RepID=UPI000CFC8AF2|nr:metalloregulator ArsR/SmtB family transcription factor [Vallitalea okinawensis]
MDFNVNEYSRVSEILKALGHPARLCIVRGLIQNKGCNVSFMQNCLSLPQSTISQHISKLKAAGIIEGSRNGLEINYTVVDDDTINIINTLFPLE